MNKGEYFDRSRQEGVVLRCPYVGRCARYISTLWFLSGLPKHSRNATPEESLVERGLLDPADLNNTIPHKGADFYEMGRENEHYYFNNGCPEVPLFDSVYGFIPKKAITSGSWDCDRKAGRYGADDKFKVDSTQHYTECAEYCSERDREDMHLNPVTGNRRVPERSDSSTISGDEMPVKEDENALRKTLNITDEKIRVAIFEGLKGFFPDQQNELRKLLNAEWVEGKLHFPDNQNRLVEVFSRAYYHGKISGSKVSVRKWLVNNFTYSNRADAKPRDLSDDTMTSIFNPSGKGEPSSGRRIAIDGLDWLQPSKRPRTGLE